MFQTYAYDGALKQAIQDKKEKSADDKAAGQPAAANDDFERLRQNQLHVLKSNPVKAYNDRMALGDPDSADLRMLGLGHSQCGNSSLLLRLFYDQFTEEPEDHELLEFEQHQMLHHYQGSDGDDTLRLSYFDLKGYDDVLSKKEMKEQIGNNITHAFNVIIFYYSVSDRSSFEDTHGGYSVQDIKTIVDEYLNLLDRNKFMLVLVALQSDCDDSDRKVSATEGQALAQKWGGIPFVEVSAKTGQNIAQLLDTICAIYMRGFDIIDGDLNEAAAFDEEAALQKTVIGEHDEYEEYKEKEQQDTRNIYDLYSPPSVRSMSSADEDGVTLIRALTAGSPRQEQKAAVEDDDDDGEEDAADNRSDGRPEMEEHADENVAQAEVAVEPVETDTTDVQVQPKTTTDTDMESTEERQESEQKQEPVADASNGKPSKPPTEEEEEQEDAVEPAAGADASEESKVTEEATATDTTQPDDKATETESATQPVQPLPQKAAPSTTKNEDDQRKQQIQTPPKIDAQQQIQTPPNEVSAADKQNDAPKQEKPVEAAAVDTAQSIALKEPNANDTVAMDATTDTREPDKKPATEPTPKVEQSPAFKIKEDDNKGQQDSKTSKKEIAGAATEATTPSKSTKASKGRKADDKPQKASQAKPKQDPDAKASKKAVSKAQSKPPKAIVEAKAEKQKQQQQPTSPSKAKKTTTPAQAPKSKPKSKDKNAAVSSKSDKTSSPAKQAGQPKQKETKASSAKSGKSPAPSKTTKATHAAKKTSDKKIVKTAAPKTSTKPSPSSSSSNKQSKAPKKVATQSQAKPAPTVSPASAQTDNDEEKAAEVPTTTTQPTELAVPNPTKERAAHTSMRPRNSGLSKHTMSVAEFCDVPLKHLFENDDSLKDNFDIAKKICMFFDNQFRDKDTVCCVAEAGKQPSISYWCKGDYVRKEKNIIGKHILVYRSCKHRPCQPPKVSPKEFEAYVKKISIENENQSVDKICDKLDEKFGAGVHFARSTSKKPAYDVYSRFSDKYDAGFKLPSGSYIIAWRR